MTQLANDWLAKSVKIIYVYPIDAQWRAKMGVAEPVGLQPLEIGQGLATAVETPITERPPHRSQRAQFTHWAPTLGV